MTTHPSIESVASSTLYIEHLFMHARSCSRRLTQLSSQLEDASRQAEDQSRTLDTLNGPEVTDLFTLLVDHENAIGNLLAHIASAVLAQAHIVETIAPGYESDLTNLEPPEVDGLMRPIFEEGGIDDDFTPWRERDPGVDEADEVR